MDEDIDNFANGNLENLVIKDKAYNRKKLIKKLIIALVIFISLLILLIVIYIILLFKSKTYGEIACVYETRYNNENIVLLKNDENLNFDLNINGKKFE